MELLKKTTDERVSEAHAQVAEARAEAAEHARVAGEAVSKALAVAQVQAELDTRFQYVIKQMAESRKRLQQERIVEDETQSQRRGSGGSSRS